MVLVREVFVRVDHGRVPVAVGVVGCRVLAGRVVLVV